MSEVYSLLKPIATWNTVRGVWETTQGNLLCEHSELFSETWPTSGMTRVGQAFELPTQVHPTTVSESSSSPTLPTPAVAHLRNHDEDLDGYLQRRQDYLDGKAAGMPGASLGVAVRLTQEGIDWQAESPLLPTPNTMEHLPARTGEARERQLHRGGSDSRRSSSGNLREDILDLMPTPTTRDYKDGSAPHERDGEVQTDTVARAIFNSGEVQLMGTPRTSSKNGATKRQVDAGAPKARIEDQVLTTHWGKFQPAIQRWEQILGRPAPAPTKPDGKDGAHRLSSKFTEWMMGVPDGWITDAGLTRNEELKACGNGVVPQQAELALRLLLSDSNMSLSLN